jgi:hypothetical protein
MPSLTQFRKAWPGLCEGRREVSGRLSSGGLAIEHQGEQHYRPLKVFGGEEAIYGWWKETPPNVGYVLKMVLRSLILNMMRRLPKAPSDNAFQDFLGVNE